MNDISVQGDWRVIKYRRWAFEKLSGTTTSGIFYTGEIVTGTISGTKGYLDYYQVDGVNGSFGIKRSNSSSYFGNGTFGGQFQVGETITGEKSGAEATIMSIDIDDIYEGKNPIPSNPGEIPSENGLDFNPIVNPTSFPIAGYSSQTLTFLQDSTTGIGTGLEVEIEFDSSGNIQNYIVTNGGQNYKNNDLITTNDLGSGSINIKVSNIKSSELTLGVKCYVQSGTALYNGVEYNVGEIFTPISEIWSSFNSLEYFQQVGSTPVVVKKLWNGVCFDNGLPYDDFTIFNEEFLKFAYIQNVNFTWAGWNSDYWRFQGKEYLRGFTYLGTVVIKNCQSVNVGALIDCSATSIRGLKSLDANKFGRVFESVFANGDGGGGNIRFEGELASNILCHSFNGGALKVDKLTSLITTNQVSISNVEIGFSQSVTFGTEQNGFSVISNSKFITELNNWFSTSSVYNNYISGYQLSNWNVYSDFNGNQIVLGKVSNSQNITINNLFEGNNIFVGELMNNTTFNGDFKNNNIICKLFGETYVETFKNNNINVETFLNNQLSGSCIFNTINSEEFSANIINGAFQYNEIKTNINAVDFTSTPATHVYDNYNCTIFKNSNLNNRLSYYSGDTLTVTDIDL